MPSWSFSAHKTLRRCQRQYVFQYMLAHHNAKDRLRKKAYSLKQLTTLPQWKGKLIHQGLENFFVPSLSKGNGLAWEEITEKTKRLGKKQLEFSRKRKFEDPCVSKSSAGLEYLALKRHAEGESYSKKEIDRVLDQVEDSFKYLADQTEFINKLKKSSDIWKELNTGFRLGEWYIRGKIDLLAKETRDNYSLVDWKVSKIAGDSKNQIQAYALTLVRNWDSINSSNVSLFEVNVKNGSITEYPLKSADLIDIENFIYRSTKRMEKIRSNISTSDPSLDILDLPDSSGTCALCNFRDLCRDLNSKNGGRNG